MTMDENVTIELFMNMSEPPYVEKHVILESDDEEEAMQKVQETMDRLLKQTGLPKNPGPAERTEALRSVFPGFFMHYSLDPRGNARDAERSVTEGEVSLVKYWGRLMDGEDPIRDLVQRCRGLWRDLYEEEPA